MMDGDSNTWDPEAYVRKAHPRARVLETDKLPPGVLGAVDFGKGIIWLAHDLPEPQRRCTLSYEIAQYRQGPTPSDPCHARAMELAALDWAARKLISYEDMCAAFRACYDLPSVAAWLDVDQPTLRARLRGLTDDEQDRVMAAIHSLHTSSA